MTKQLLQWDEQPAKTQGAGGTAYSTLFHQVMDLLLTECCFLNPKLKAEHLCRRLQISPKTLLKALKKHGFTSFPHFVNHHRVEAVKSMMAQEAFDIYTLEAIAEKAGFGTRQAFYNTFERLTGMKPASYRKMVQKQNSAIENIRTTL